MRRALSVLAAFGALCAHAQAPAKPAVAAEKAAPASTGAPAKPAAQGEPGPLAAFGWLGELAGACWRGDRMENRSSETQCYSIQHGRLLRGSVKVVAMMDDAIRTVFEGEAVFASDAETKRVLYSQWGMGAVYSTGEITVDGDALVLRNRAADGTPLDQRSVWKRTGPDGYRVTREEKSGPGWKAVSTVDYQRLR